MIVPVGKYKPQVSSGHMKHADLWTNDFLNQSTVGKIAVTGLPSEDKLGLNPDQSATGDSPENTPSNDLGADLGRAMNDSSNPRMRPSDNNAISDSQHGLVENQVGQGQTPYDPYTGKPNSNAVIDFGNVAKTIQEFVKGKFQGAFEVTSMGRGKDGGFTFTVGPVQQGPVVTKK